MHSSRATIPFNQRHAGRRLQWLACACLVAGLLFSCWTSVAAAADPAQDKQVAFDRTAKPMLAQYCVDCHSGSEPAGGLALNHLDSTKTLIKERRIWEKVLQRVEIGDMPPQEAEKPTEAMRKAFGDWGRHALADVECGKTPNPGHVTLRRLNRKEYYNSVRDLIGVEYQAAVDFPGDDVGYGFDNIGDVLTLPPLLMEKYLRAAEEISQKAILAPEPGAAFEVAHNGGQLKAGGGAKTDGKQALFYSNGTAEFSEQLTFPAAYQLEFTAGGDQGGDEPVKMLVYVDDRKIKELAIKATRKEPQLYTLTLKLRPGKRTIKFEFTNDFYQDSKDGKPKQDRNAYIFDVKLAGREAGAKLDPSKLPASHKALVTVEPGGKVTTEEAFRKVLTPIVSRAFRRPVGEEELKRFIDLASSAHEDGESYEGCLQLALQAVLVSPHFLFKVEQPRTDVGDRYPKLNDFELATRISYFLWSTTPDDRLLSLAYRKELSKPDVLRAEVKRMIMDKRSNAFVENFAGQWLTLPKLRQFEPNKQMFPQWNDRIRDLLRYETLAFFAGVMREDQNIFTLIDADFTYLNEELAKFYGIPNVSGSHFRKVSTKGYPRKGLLTQGAVLAVTSNPTRTSPVKRGKWILENLLGTPPPPAPPNVPELEKGALMGTLRQRMEQHRTNPACASCHKLMDPLGFALENFDAIGQWRTKDGADKIVPEGELPGGVPVKDAGDLIRNIRNQQADKFARCLTEKLMTFALGRGLEYYDKCAVDKIMTKLAADDYRFTTLVCEIMLSDPFQRMGDREEL
ncbi:MAG: DUF1592 domain-containing protein [Pirellulales bacterium]